MLFIIGGLAETVVNPKRRRRFALPAHSISPGLNAARETATRSRLAAAHGLSGPCLRVHIVFDYRNAVH